MRSPCINVAIVKSILELFFASPFRLQAIFLETFSKIYVVNLELENFSYRTFDRLRDFYLFFQIIQKSLNQGGGVRVGSMGSIEPTDFWSLHVMNPWILLQNISGIEYDYHYLDSSLV